MISYVSTVGDLIKELSVYNPDLKIHFVLRDLDEQETHEEIYLNDMTTRGLIGDTETTLTLLFD